MYRSVATPRFWDLFDRLPQEIQARAEKQYEIFSTNPGHPSLHLKQAGAFWSVRVTDTYRALGLRDGIEFTWVWIGSHDEYERLIG
jgi:hypothetical protein